MLAAIERNGRIEATRTTCAEAFRSLLDNTRERVTDAQTEIRHVSALGGSLDLGHVTGSWWRWVSPPHTTTPRSTR